MKFVPIEVERDRKDTSKSNASKFRNKSSEPHEKNYDDYDQNNVRDKSNTAMSKKSKYNNDEMR